MPKNRSKSIIDEQAVVADEHQNARFAQKSAAGSTDLETSKKSARVHVDGMSPTAIEFANMHAKDMLPIASECARMYADIESSILKNTERVNADGKPPTLRKERHSSGEAMPKKCQQWEVD
jgi:hypothetical protein